MTTDIAARLAEIDRCGLPTADKDFDWMASTIRDLAAKLAEAERAYEAVDAMFKGAADAATKNLARAEAAETKLAAAEAEVGRLLWQLHHQGHCELDEDHGENQHGD